jgi:predicted anti-sigma-YlaC factor YlaD
MTCQELDERLDDWVDGALGVAAAAEIEEHLAACDACRQDARRLRQLVAHAAALPRSLAPEHDLWPAIEPRLARPWTWPARLGWGQSLLLAAAALAVVLVGGIVWRQQSKGIVRTAEMPAPDAGQLSTVSATAPEAPLSDPVLARAERDYESAANALLAALQQRRAALRPETLAAVQADLQVIDRALAEVRQALAADPHNPELNRMLVSTHRKKVDVLRRVVMLSTAL